jgi:hypothetical protein
MHPSRSTYEPINTLKPVAENVWIVDGPLIRFGMPWPKFPFPTRMTIVRLPGERLFVHSPTPLQPALENEIRAIGKPEWIVGPNRIHYWWIPEWQEKYTRAAVFLAPRIQEQAGGRIDFEAHSLNRDSGYPWDDELATLPVSGRFMTEVVFFHRSSRTLILTDLIENFERSKLSLAMRWVTRLGAAQDPDGQMPRDMRISFSKHQDALRAAVRQMIEWNPERIILAHGRWYERDAVQELRRAFRWLSL